MQDIKGWRDDAKATNQRFQIFLGSFANMKLHGHVMNPTYTVSSGRDNWHELHIHHEQVVEDAAQVAKFA